MNLEDPFEYASHYGDVIAELTFSCYSSPTPFSFDTLSCKYDAPLRNSTGIHVIIEFEIIAPSKFFMRQRCGGKLPIKKLIKRLRATGNITDIKVYQVRQEKFIPSIFNGGMHS